MAEQELDVRPMRKPDKHPAIFAAFDALAAGEAFVLVNNHDPVHLRDEFELHHPGGYGWEYAESGPVWRVRISKLTSTPLPRVLVDTTALAAAPSGTGAIWRLPLRGRDLDSNLVHLDPAGSIDSHHGPDHDVLVHVVAGSGSLATEGDEPVALTPGALVWLPRRSERAITAGPDGLTYLTVHQRRTELALDQILR